MRPLEQKLGCWESIHALIHDLAYGHGKIVCTVSLSGQLNPTLICQALEQLHQRHPLLQATHTLKRKGYFFRLDAKFSSIPFQVKMKHDDNTWQDIVEQELAQPFPTDQYLWGATLLCPSTPQGNTEIILFFSHAICDGLSVASFLDELLTVYCKLEQGEAIDLPPLPLLPPIDILVQQAKKTKDAFITKQLAQPISCPWPYSNSVPLGQRKTKNVYRHLSMKQYKLIEQTCRQQHITVHAALNAAVLLTAGSFGNVNNISLQTPINLRRYCQPTLSNENFGCYVSMVTTQHTCNPQQTSLWDAARDYRAQLKSALPHASAYLPNFSLRMLRKLLDKLCLNPRDHFTLGFGVTNAGRLNLPTAYGKHRIKFLYGSTSRQAADFVILISAATFNDELFLTFNFTEPMLSINWVEDFADDMLARLLSPI